MKVKSMIRGTINDYLRTVTSIEIDGDIIIFTSTIKDICIDTKRGVSSRTVNGLKKAKRKVYATKNCIRDRFDAGLPGRKNTTMGYLAQLVAVAKYIIQNDITEFDGYEGLEANHIDYSGNMLARGFSNNSLYNIELVSCNDNDYHRVCEQTLYRIFGMYFGISATDTELLNKIRYSDDIELRQYFATIGNDVIVDDYGTVFIGTAKDNFKTDCNMHKKVTF